MPFQKGNQHAKGHGRPKNAISINDELRKLLANKDAESKKKYVEILAKKIFAEALKGNDRLLIALWEQMEGKPAQNVNLGGQEDNPVKVQFEYIDPKADDE